MKRLYVIKIGGNIIDDEQKLPSFLRNFASISEEKILVHGGGKMATKIAEQLNIPQQIIDGRRITDTETLKVVTMVYAGYINKNIVAQLQAFGCNAVGFTGADGNLMHAHKRARGEYGFAGDVDKIKTGLLTDLLEQKLTPVVAPITHDKKGQLLNTNADTVAQEIAKALSKNYGVSLIYCFEKNGVLMNADDENSAIKQISRNNYTELKNRNKVAGGMIPKLDNAFDAVSNGVEKVVIGQGEHLNELIAGTSGTCIINE
ncbi:MAG: acetylglutamate kinase [Chitinophagaceae bacterium]|nr:acetylglutamate kinase [Chitinophagaceae bacterium]